MFLTVRDYRNEYGEVSHFNIVFHADYLSAVERSLDILKQYKPKLKDCTGFTIWDLEQAKKDLLRSLKTSSKKEHTHVDDEVYDAVSNKTGDVIPGIKLHSKQDVLHLEGLRIQKRIITRGIYPTVTSKQLTLAKDFLREQLPVGQWRQFKLLPGKFSAISVGSMSITDRQVTRIR